MAGGFLRMWRALRTRNACKTCALGMGGQAGGMVNEAGRFPEVCKKSVQAMAADMRGAIRPGFFEEFGFDQLSRLSSRQLEAAGRLTQPLYAGPGDRSFRAIPWDEAIARISARLGETPPNRTFFYFSGRSSNEAGFLLQLFARMYGTNNVNNCSYFCHQASGVGLTSAIGSGTATVALEDVAGCDLIFVIGGNPASNHPRFMRTLIDLRRAGGSVVVVNPMREVGLVNFRVPSDVRSLLFGSKIADEYVMPHIGGDIAFLSGVAKVVLEADAADERFVTEHGENWGEFRAGLERLTWDEIETGSGVRRDVIERVGKRYAAARRVIFAWTMGITHHEHGVQNVQMIANLALMRGMIGRSGAGLLPLRGHSNVQGIGSMGVTPALAEDVSRALKERFGVGVSREPGLDTLGSIRAADAGTIDLAWRLGGNLFGSCPDAGMAARALSKVGLTIDMSTALNTGHIHGRGREAIILPVLARDEEPQSTTQESMFSFVRMSEGGQARHVGPRSEVSIIASIARATLGDGGPIDFASMEEHSTIRRAIAAVVPGYGAIGDIDRTKREFHVENRALRGAAFRTPSGRAVFHAVPLPPRGPDDELRLMTIRSEGQFNTVVYEEEDAYRGQERRDVILMNAADMARLGLRDDDRVTVTSAAGEMRGIRVREFDIRAGNAAMYYPEANVLVEWRADARSKTPSFKNVSVKVTKERSLTVIEAERPAATGEGSGQRGRLGAC